MAEQLLVPEEKDYGAVKEEEELAAAAPSPIEPTPSEADEQSLESVLEATQGAREKEDLGALVPTTGERETPNMWRIPHRYDRIFQSGDKSFRQGLEDIGAFWQVLAESAGTDPAIRAIAESILGGRRGSTS